ncbi:MAG TPA: response regulator transcription factor [Candidatus Faecaligallichristensenella faecipullorum]|nr:response regulator transcription factor [Candidatus Faecaligallichristensenella faecipullorum]
MRILIVEDDVRLAGTLADMISEAGDMADIAYDGETGLDNALSGIYDALVLDVMLPKMDGFELLLHLRKKDERTPVLMLTAKSELDDRVRGLDLGADYYLTKPFENAEFLACLRAVLRRQGDMTPEQIRFGDLTLTPQAGELRKGERALSLNAKELELMRLLMLNSNQILPKETLLMKVWGYDTEASDNNVEAYISFLRKKLTLLGSKVTISVVRRVGYRLEEANP